MAAAAALLSLSLPKLNVTKASASTAGSTITCGPDTLEHKFGRKGIKFSEPGEVELTVRNGSSVKLQIPNAHVTSYKPKVYWKDDGFEEVLYTLPPSNSSSSCNSRGGIGLVINEILEPNPKRPAAMAKITAAASASEWTVTDVDFDSIDALQVELSCSRGTLDINYVVSLYPLSMATAVIVKNNGRKPVKLTTAILSHLKSKTRAGTGIQGLRGCTYCIHPPFSSSFEILSPAEAMKTEEPHLFSFGWEPEKKPGIWSAQDVPITVLKHKLSRLYSVPPQEKAKQFYNSIPSKYETIDQGRELFFRIIRMGFEDIYLSSPGSYSEKYGKDYFICTGPASMLVPLVVNPGEEWRGAQQLQGLKNICVVRMVLENFSIANLMLPSGLITSYKGQMWHGGTMELLHTIVSEGQNGSPVIEGGVSLACNCGNDERFSWSPSSWALHQVKGDPKGSIQVELICTSSDGKIEAKYMVTLQQDLLTSEIKVFNLGMASLRMMDSVLSHLTVSTPEASYAVGLQGSDFFSKTPFLANFSLLPPGFGKRKNQASNKYFGEIVSCWGTKNQNYDDTEKELEGEERDNYKHLTDEMSKIYKSTPRNFTLIDRGRRNSVVVGRDGFKVYVLSPGSRHDSYGRYSYICVGQAALLQPIVIESQSEWRGKQSLHNPNM
ncbi:hypothetical protein K7X08_000014 [Anisodus acutangulus]|uniref:Uncharacterized protein n=1 Tax=Anisodus acutangulus TaxID=402998 RepID=A0A9Q1QV26_9SOLA|nr:hypothetical protein K7X08_000014 [Anisodus acutangulus]